VEYEFDLDNAISSLDNVPDDLKHFYSQGEGGYRVSANMTGAAKRLNGLTTNLKTERSKKTAANNEAAQFRTQSAGFKALLDKLELPEDKRNPEGLAAVIDELTTKANAGGRKGEEAARQLEAVKAEMTRSHQTALAAKDQELQGMQGSLFKYMVGDVANTALAEHKGNPLFLRPHIDRMTKVVKEDNGEYVVRVLDDKGQIKYNGEGNPMTVPELVATLKKDDRFAAAFEGRVQGGGGAPAGRKMDPKQAANAGGEKTAHQRIADGLKARRAAR
jgi:hypothetical protein